jgi:L-iditol 2-dehydrogenase
VLVRIERTGVCGSDVHYFEHGRIGDHLAESLTRLGHESCGVVAALGPGVVSHRLGDRVAIEPQKPCGACKFCLEGRYNLCPSVEFLASPPVPGTFCDYVAHPAGFCYRIPDTMDATDGALLEPLAVGFHAAAQAGARVGQSAVVLGAGCIGLCTMLALKARGVHNVYVTDVIPARLGKALEMGAAGAFDAGSEGIVEALLTVTGGNGADIVIETAGAEATARSTATLCARGGTIVLVGLAADPVEYPFNVRQHVIKELTIKTVFRYRNAYPACIDAASRIPLRLGAMVSRTFPFDEIHDAFVYNVERKRDIVKVVIDHAR